MLSGISQLPERARQVSHGVAEERSPRRKPWDGGQSRWQPRQGRQRRCWPQPFFRRHAALAAPDRNSRLMPWAILWRCSAALAGFLKADWRPVLIFCRALTLLLLFAPFLPAQEGDSYKSKPAGHDKNKQLAASAHEANLKRHANDTNILVLPGLVADKRKQRIEVMVESTGLREGAACEFTIIGEASQHAYEALMISFAQPSALHQALQFIGQEPGEPMDPGSLRFWARGECCRLSVLRGKEPPIRLEKLLVDRRTGKTLTEEGFRFVGSRMVPALNDPGKKVYAADVYQPVALVSLFNSTYSVLEVPYTAAKGEAYQNTSINPELKLTEEGLLTLVIEPLDKSDAKRAKDLVLEVQAAQPAAATSVTGLERLNYLSFQLKDAEVVLNQKPTLSSVMEALAPLDRKRHDYYLTVRFGNQVELGSAQALAKILAIIDCERGIRIEPPPAGHLCYRAFTPDRDLLDREARLYHPWELALTESNGVVSGKLLRVNSVYKSGVTKSELEITEVPVSGPQKLRNELEAEAELTAKAKTRSKPPVVMVFATATLTYGQLIRFLEPVLPTHKTIHVYVDEPMPPLPQPKP